MKMPNDKLPLFAEERILNQEEQLNLQEVLSQFQQLVPADFVELATKGNNYMCSTQGWKEPVCERYMFFNNGQPVQLDIPQELMVKLELESRENIPYPVFISPNVLNKELSFGALTIENEQEIFIQKPLTIENLEKELEKWLREIKNSREQISHLTNTEQLNQANILNLQWEIDNLKASKKDREIELRGEKQLSQAQKEAHRNKVKNLQGKLQEKENKITELEREKEQTENNLKNEVRELKENLEKEQNWLDKYFGNNISDANVLNKVYSLYPEFQNSVKRKHYFISFRVNGAGGDNIERADELSSYFVKRENIYAFLKIVREIYLNR